MTASETDPIIVLQHPTWQTLRPQDISIPAPQGGLASCLPPDRKALLRGYGLVNIIVSIHDYRRP